MSLSAFASSTWNDLRFGGRLLVKNPTFSIVAVLTLALGTGANAAIFQLVNSVRMRPLPVERPHELVSLRIETNGTGRTGRFMGRSSFFSEPLWQAIRTEQQAFASVATWGNAAWNIATDGEYRPVQGLYVNGGFFDTFGVNAQVGRLFAEADDQKGCGAPGVVLAHGFWQARYAGSPAAVGQSITLDGRTFDIIGVTPKRFFGPEVGRTFDVAVPLCAEPLFRGAQTAIGQPDTWFLDIMGRLKPGWTADRAQAQLATVAPGIFAATVPPRYNPETAKNYAAFTLTVASAATGVSNIRRAYETQLWVLLGATGLVLLITCANLANLMLARATAREREIAVRLAIGASRWRLVRQMLSESFLIAALGAAGGVLLAQWFSRSLVSFLSTQNSQVFLDLTPDWQLFAFIASLAVLACLLFGLSPALKVTGTNPGQSMQSGGRSSTDAHGRFAVRRGLVVVQVALSMVLIVGALLFGRSLRNLVTVDPGFRADGVVSVDIDLRRSSVTDEARLATLAQIMERVRAVPGVSHAAETWIVPMSGSGWNQNVTIDGEEKPGNVNMNQVGPEFFTTMGTPLVAGRAFGPDDRPGSTPAAIVNESFARTFYGGANPVGRVFQVDPRPGRPNPTFHIVGMVKDTKYFDLREEFGPMAYFPTAQEPPERRTPDFALLVRADLPAASLTPVLTRTIREVVPGATVAFSTLERYMQDSLVTERLMASLSGFFGVLAMLIATIGLYGVMSYTVSRRRIEIGIRMALGADPGTVVRMVLRESGMLLAAGVLIGVGLAVAAARWAQSLLFGMEAWDPASFAGAVGALGVVSLLASWIPARRAARVAPTVALRAD